MPVIRISDATWDRLKRWAVPLEDTPDDAVRKVLDTAEKHPNDSTADVHSTRPVSYPPVTEKRISGGRGWVTPLLRPDVRARYLEGEKVIVIQNNPTALARVLHIRPAKFVLGGHPWDSKTYGTEGYRTTVHAFTANGYDVDIGDGWGQYKNEGVKPYGKFDSRKATRK